MKRNLSIRKNLALLAAVLGTYAASAQTITGNITTQPCNNNGQISVSVTGLTPPITYQYSNWNAGQNVMHTNVNSTSDNLTGIGAYFHPWWGPSNVWYVTASDGVGNASMTFTLTAPFTLDSIKVTPAACPAQATVQAVNINGGTSPYSVTWTNVNTNTPYNGNPIGVPNGNYSMTITDGANCMIATATTSGNIWVANTSGMSANITTSPANCTNGSAQVSASGGTSPYTYLWGNNATSQSITGLTQGQVQCMVTDAIGCSAQGWGWVAQAVTINYNSTVGPATCLQNDGSITSFVSGGTSPYTFNWSNNATSQSLSNIPGGNYQVMITDANGCIGQGWVFVPKTTPIAVTFTSTPSSCTSPTGGATLTATGGQSPYSIIWYTFPTNSAGLSISSKPPGNYAFQVTDGNGCIQTGAAIIGSASTLNAGINGSQVVCPANTGNLSVSASGTNGPFTYLWSNSSTGTSLSNMPLGAYNCTVTDAVGCKVVASGAVQQTSPVNLGFVTTPAQCLYSANGNAIAQATGGQAPYSYAWSNNQTGPSNTNLLTGFYWCTATDANGCKKSAQTFVANSQANTNCFCTITGTVYNDANSNCSKDFGESGIANLQVQCSGFGYAYTNSNGVYSFQVPTGTYTLTRSAHAYYPKASCETVNKVVSVTAGNNCVSTANFASSVIPVSDLKIQTWNTFVPPIPGNPYTQQVIVTNEGTIVENTAKFGYKHDGQLSFASCTPWSLTQQNVVSGPNWYSMLSGFPSLQVNASSAATFSYNVATNIPLNTVVEFRDTIAKAAPIVTQWLTDNTPWNNVNLYYPVVVGSYDPNYKEVSPIGEGPQGNVSTTDTVFNYVVHFQNEGTYFAQNVVVVDSLDSDFNIKTLRPGYADHSFTTRITDNGVATWEFKNINLPWKSAYGDALSSGLFTYSIRVKKGLPIGTKLTNKAAIYFDFNEPIITNTTLNTIAVKKVGIAETKMYDRERLMLFPNPTNKDFAAFVISDKPETGVLRVYDAGGRLVSQRSVNLVAGENVIAESSENMEAGIYLVQLSSPSLQLSHKLVMVK